MGYHEEGGTVSAHSPMRMGDIICRIYPAVSLIFLLSYALSMVIGIYLFFFTPEGAEFSSKSLTQLAFYIFYNTKLRLQGSLTVGWLFLLLSTLFTAAFFVAALSNVRYSESARGLLHKNDPHCIFSNFLMAMPAICSAAFVSFSLIHVIEANAGLPVGGIVFPDPFQEILLTSYAAFIEEVGFRLVPIAFPVAVYLLFQSAAKVSNMRLKERLTVVALALFKPESFRRRMGLGRDRSLLKLKAMLILASSVMFSYAHVASGAWESGKVITTFMGGIVFGYCCLRYGWESSLLIHWFFNSYWSILSCASTLNTAFAAFYDLSFLMALYMGFASLLAFGSMALSKIASWQR